MRIRHGAMTDPDAAALRARIEVRLGRTVRALEPMTPGLGLRRFYRVRCEGEPASLVARLDLPEDPAGRPEGVPPEPPLEPVRALLEARGLPVPGRVGTDAPDDLALLEDVGDRTLERAVAEEPERSAGWYDEVVGLLPTLQATEAKPGVEAFRRRLDEALFHYKGELFARWSLPAALGRTPSAAERSAVRDGFAAIAAEMSAAPLRLAHRDLQSRNLFVHEGRVRWIDLQGAFLAPPEYDLVCLLRDSYVELPAALRATLCETIRPALPDAPSAAAFRRRFDLLTLTRKGKDHARFLYAEATRADLSQRSAVPATVRALHEAAAAFADDPAVAPLAELVLALPEGAS